MLTLNRWRTWTVGCIVLICLLLGPGGMTYAQAAWTDYRLIAHGLGEISSVTVTNSHEAFVTSYNKGHRVFEADLLLTQDGQLVARHDWSDYLSTLLKQPLTNKPKDQPLTFQAFQNTKILGKYQPLTYKDLVLLLKKYPDAYLITDTKETDPQLVEKQFRQIVEITRSVDPAILNRVVPELFSPGMIKQVQQIYPFSSYLFSLYLSGLPESQIVNYVKKYNVKAVAMPYERANEAYVRQLNQAGALVYVHTTNNQAEISKFDRMGVHGFYTDRLDYRKAGVPVPVVETKIAASSEDQLQNVSSSELQPEMIKLWLSRLIELLETSSAAE